MAAPEIDPAIAELIDRVDHLRDLAACLPAASARGFVSAALNLAVLVQVEAASVLAAAEGLAGAVGADPKQNLLYSRSAVPADDAAARRFAAGFRSAVGEMR